MPSELELITIERDKYLFAIDLLKGAVSSREAKFSINFQMVDNHGGTFQATIREGCTPEIIKQVFESRKAFVDTAVANGYRVPGRVIEITPVATPPANGAPPVPPPPAASAQEGGESACQMIEVASSYTGGKTQLKFHCNGLEHPLTYTKSPTDMSKLLAPLGYAQAHIVVGQKYSANCIVKWVQGEKYKNVSSVRPA